MKFYFRFIKHDPHGGGGGGVESPPIPVDAIDVGEAANKAIKLIGNFPSEPGDKIFMLSVEYCDEETGNWTTAQISHV